MYKATINVHQTNYSQEDTFNNTKVEILKHKDLEELEIMVEDFIEENTYESYGDFGLCISSSNAILQSIDKTARVK